MIPELINFLLIFQTASLLLFFKAYQNRDEIIWVLSVILSGTLAFIFYSTISLTIVAILNLGVFLISIIFFFIDLFANHSFEWVVKLRGKYNG